MNYRVLFALSSSLLFCTPGFAEDKAESKPLSAEMSLGVLITSGNTKSTAYTGKLDVKQDLNKWLTHYVLTGLQKKDQVTLEDGTPSDDTELSAQRYFASAQADYKLNEQHRGLFVFASHEQDKFNSYEYQRTLSVGYADRLFKTETTEFNYNIGPGMSFYKTREVEEGGVVTEPSREEESAIVRVAADFTWNISDNSTFKQTLASDYAPSSDDNTKTRSETSLLTKINSKFSMKLAYIMTNNSIVAEEDENTDTEASASLVYSY